MADDKSVGKLSEGRFLSFALSLFASLRINFPQKLFSHSEGRIESSSSSKFPSKGHKYRFASALFDGENEREWQCLKMGMEVDLNQRKPKRVLTSFCH